jgi:hypothetical protein
VGGCVAQEWLRRLREGINLEEDEVERLMAEFLAIFFVDDAYLASRDPDLLQEAIDLFERVGLETNKQKTVAMTCTPGRCWSLEEGSTITITKIKMFLQIMLSNLCWESYMRKTRVLFLVTGKDNPRHS